MYFILTVIMCPQLQASVNGWLEPSVGAAGYSVLNVVNVMYL